MIEAPWVVLPTYNEAENITSVIRRIRLVFAGDILIVDDASPDGTGALVAGLQAHDPRLHLLSRSGKLGLGSAYRQGFRYALDHGASAIVQLDADGSHDPALIPDLLSNLRDIDLVIASRYVPGGRFPIVWYRRWISTLGNLYIRSLLGWSVRDWSAGYKAWRGSTARAILQFPAVSVGYAWQIEMTWLARQHGYRIREQPLIFEDRRAGRSKFTPRIIREDIRLTWQLARRNSTLASQGKK